MILPNLIIAGVNKAGTTSLFSYLSRHPDIGASKVKETCYFLPYRYGEPMKSIDEYAQYFDHLTDKRYVMESTPGYFYGGMRMARKIDETLPGVRIIIILRDPVDRLLSHYSFMKAMLDIDKDISFEDYLYECMSIDDSEIETRKNNRWYGVQGGRYEKHIEPWLDVFDGRVKLLFFDDLRDNRSLLLKDICSWLELHDDIFELLKLDVENKTLQYKSKEMQRLALWINNKGERIFRKYPDVKTFLRNGYRKINSSKKKEVISSELKEQAKTYYSDTYEYLAFKLKSRGFDRLPVWLRD
jgi:hypothetical protein